MAPAGRVTVGGRLARSSRSRVTTSSAFCCTCYKQARLLVSKTDPETSCLALPKGPHEFDDPTLAQIAAQPGPQGGHQSDVYHFHAFYRRVLSENGRKVRERNFKESLVRHLQ